MRHGNFLALLVLCGLLASAIGCGPSGPTTVKPAANGGATPATGAASEAAAVP